MRVSAGFCHVARVPNVRFSPLADGYPFPFSSIILGQDRIRHPNNSTLRPGLRRLTRMKRRGVTMRGATPFLSAVVRSGLTHRSVLSPPRGKASAAAVRVSAPAPSGLETPSVALAGSWLESLAGCGYEARSDTGRKSMIFGSSYSRTAASSSDSCKFMALIKASVSNVGRGLSCDAFGGSIGGTNRECFARTAPHVAL